jgi:Flp pilus assembly protein, secretin CpaC
VSAHRILVRGRAMGRIAAFGLVAAVVNVAIAMGAAAAEDLIVKYDQSQLWRLERPIAEIIIGNPTIADVTIQSNDLLVVTGKSFGITNIIALDANREVVAERRVLVQRDERKVVNLHKGGKRESYNCSPQCNPMTTIGDDPEYFETVAKLSERKIKLSSGAGSADAN